MKQEEFNSEIAICRGQAKKMVANAPGVSAKNAEWCRFSINWAKANFAKARTKLMRSKRLHSNKKTSWTTRK